MKQNFDCKLLYSDTDSFVYEVQTEDFFADIESKQLTQLFDFSKFPRNHPQYDGSNAKVTLKFKDEMAGRTVSEFVGLKPKLYSIKLSEGKYFFIYSLVFLLDILRREDVRRRNRWFKLFLKSVSVV